MATKTKTKTLEISFTKERETKGTFVYAEDETDDAPVVGTLYLKKHAAKKLGDPETITITITVN